MWAIIQVHYSVATCWHWSLNWDTWHWVMKFDPSGGALGDNVVIIIVTAGPLVCQWRSKFMVTHLCVCGDVNDDDDRRVNRATFRKRRRTNEWHGNRWEWQVSKKSWIFFFLLRGGRLFNQTDIHQVEPLTGDTSQWNVSIKFLWLSQRKWIFQKLRHWRVDCNTKTGRAEIIRQQMAK